MEAWMIDYPPHQKKASSLNERSVVIAQMAVQIYCKYTGAELKEAVESAAELLYEAELLVGGR